MTAGVHRFLDSALKSRRELRVGYTPSALTARLHAVFSAKVDWLVEDQVLVVEILWRPTLSQQYRRECDLDLQRCLFVVEPAGVQQLVEDRRRSGSAGKPLPDENRFVAREVRTVEVFVSLCAIASRTHLLCHVLHLDNCKGRGAQLDRAPRPTLCLAHDALPHRK